MASPGFGDQFQPGALRISFIEPSRIQPFVQAMQRQLAGMASRPLRIDASAPIRRVQRSVRPGSQAQVQEPVNRPSGC